LRRLAEQGEVTLREATRSPRKPLACLPTTPAPRLSHQVRESVTFSGGIQFIRCETCGVSLARKVGMEDRVWAKRKAAFHKRHPAQIA